MLEFGNEGLSFGLVGEVVTLDAPVGDGVDDAVHDLLQAGLALRRAEGAAEVLLGKDVGRVNRPRGRHFDAELLEGHGAVTEVRDPGVATVPDDLVVRVAVFGGEEAAKSDS